MKVGGNALSCGVCERAERFEDEMERREHQRKEIRSSFGCAGVAIATRRPSGKL